MIGSQKINQCQREITMVMKNFQKDFQLFRLNRQIKYLTIVRVIVVIITMNFQTNRHLTLNFKFQIQLQAMLATIVVVEFKKIQLCYYYYWANLLQNFLIILQFAAISWIQIIPRIIIFIKNYFQIIPLLVIIIKVVIIIKASFRVKRIRLIMMTVVIIPVIAWLDFKSETWNQTTSN